MIEILVAADMVMAKTDSHTRDSRLPNIALRDPYSPLTTLTRLAEEFTPDDLFLNPAAFDYVGSLLRTKFAIDNPNEQRPDKLDPVLFPEYARTETSAGDGSAYTKYVNKIDIYKFGGNAEAINTLLKQTISVDGCRWTLESCYRNVFGIQSEIKEILARNPKLKWNDEVGDVATLRALSVSMKANLRIMCQLFVQGQEAFRDNLSVKVDGGASTLADFDSGIAGAERVFEEARGALEADSGDEAEALRVAVIQAENVLNELLLQRERAQVQVNVRKALLENFVPEEHYPVGCGLV